MKRLLALAFILFAGAALADNSFVAPTAVGTASPGQIPGTTTNDNASTGNVGEYVQSVATHGNSTVTISQAAPGIITWAAHGLNIASPVNFTTSGALPTGLTVGTNYYACSTSFAAGSFAVATSVANALAGTCVTTSSAGSGTQTAVSSVTITTGTAFDVTGISLTAGDWDIDVVGGFFPANTTSVTQVVTSISSSSSALNTAVGRLGVITSAATIFDGATQSQVSLPPYRISLPSTTTIFMEGQSTFSLAGNVAFGIIRARRAR
jgi:hypothetical protein